MNVNLFLLGRVLQGSPPLQRILGYESRQQWSPHLVQLLLMKSGWSNPSDYLSSPPVKFIITQLSTRTNKYERWWENSHSCLVISLLIDVLNCTDIFVCGLHSKLSDVKNKVYFIANYERHGVSSRQSKNFHLPSASTSIYQHGVQYSGVKLFNKLPTALKECADNVKQFKSLLKTYSTTHCFYTLDEFLYNE